MALRKYSYALEFTEVTPSCCNVPFMMLLSQYKARGDDHKSFYCPSCGEGRYFPSKSDNEILTEKLAAEKRGKELAQRQATYERNCARAQKAAKTRLKNRIKHGVCPCCQRTFKQLADHMKNKHPEYIKE